MKAPDANDILRARGADGLRSVIDETRAEPLSPSAAPARPNGGEAPDQAPAFSDEALALRFAERHASHLRFVAGWGKWLSWTGTHWRFDDTLAALDKAREICREAAAKCNEPNVDKRIASKATVYAVECLARADRRLAATIDQWDADLWLLNTPSGIIDLRTGQSRPHRADDHMTKITSVGPRGECKLFLDFLDQVSGGGAEIVSYLQRVLGYALTGDIREHALFFAYGTGANGKSVLLSTVAGILGEYHRTAPIETFVASNSDRHPTDLAGLRGARLVTANETEEGRRWAKARIKQLTGGDPIPARFMRQDFFEYRPAFKLVIAGNHKPSLRSVDEAIRRRFHLIPFAVTIPPEKRDAELTEKLKAEWPGILAWMIEGALQWQRKGLRPPNAILDATAAYLESEDAVAAWLHEKCERDPNAWASSSHLFASWTAWANAAGETIGSQKALTGKLEDKGFTKKDTNKAKGFLGLRIIPDEPLQPHWSERK